MPRNDQDIRSDFAIARCDLDPILDSCSESMLQRVFQDVNQDAKFTSTSAQSMIPLADYFRILKALTTELHDETVHLSSRHLLPGATGYIVGSLSSCNTLQASVGLINVHSQVTLRPYGATKTADSALERCCCGLIPRTRLNAELNENGVA